MSKKINLGPVTAYAIAAANGFTGTVKEWLESLRGEPGPKGDPGEKGDPGQQGDPGPAGVGVPDGGTDGQFLGKTADGTAWVDPPQSGLPSGGTPYQQLVTDGNGNAKWEDRLAYVATEEQVIFSQENIAFTESGRTYASGTMPITAISVGEKYYVDFDGETYDCIAHTMLSGVPDPVIIGNSSIVGGLEDTGEPFCVLYSIEDQKIQIVTTLTSPTHTVSISRVVETVHKIPQVYLPEKTKVYVRIDEGSMYFDSERTRQLSAEDFISAVNSGGIDFIKLPISSEEVHLQMIGYKINKNSGTVTANVASVNDDGSTMVILAFDATPAGAPSQPGAPS